MYTAALALALALVLALLLLRRGAAGPEVQAPGACLEPDWVPLDETRPYVAVGTLANEDQKVLQLYAKPCASHRDRWHYHTAVDDQRVPVELAFKGRRCHTDRIGCERIYTGDEVTATEFGTSAPLRVQLYGE